MQLFEGLRQQIAAYLDPEQVEQVAKAYVLARDAHEGQHRTSGEPYITHPVAVAGILATLRLDAQSLMAALMHDVIEDCGVTKEQLIEQFGPQVADLVEGVSKLTQIQFGSKAEQQAENFRKMMMAMTRDIRVILIKLADRLHNMQTLGALAPHKRRRIAQETLEIYAPIANRLGMYSIRQELEDLGFAALYPVRYAVLRNAVKRARGNRKEIISGIAQAIEAKLQKAGINARVVGREKSLFSIYNKMKTRVGSFAEVMDIYGFRIITDSEDSCYRVLGQVHNLYKPVPGRFKDYVAIPKTNGYQSLHTVLKGPHGLHVEVQIRTEVMEQMANNGVAAHFLYKTGSAPNPAELRAREWLRSVIEFQQRAGDSMEFVENVKIDLFPDEVYVFTPNGNILELPVGATPVDFAYAIHTDVGNACVAAKIDRQLAPLSTILRNGQTVEIVTAPGARPNPTWLSFVATGKARANIRHFLKNQRRDESVAMGRRLLENALHEKPIEQFPEDERKRVALETKHKSFEDLLADIGIGQIPAIAVAHRLDPERRQIKRIETGTEEPLAIRGTEGMLVSYARCCCPIPGDPIIGVLSAGRGITVHMFSCHNTAEFISKPGKTVPLQWEKDVKGEFAVELEVDVINQRGVLAQLTSTIADEEANIVNLEIDPRDGSYNTIVFMVQVRGRLHLANIMRRLRAMSEVNRIVRHHRAQPERGGKSN
ncbi:MAG TPA: bifunctional GTP diphosphokinase/guanosine-3',5'-bis pyrophosphate 3'-pyrophosphohydrolase [Permianibacter sp.]|nr:bifunctional GTP diphosphokinase/guanosine-3',5'-bis pyrophosphate 3'-pyrophosphohydrolase [Permianibacter sp.]